MRPKPCHRAAGLALVLFSLHPFDGPAASSPGLAWQPTNGYRFARVSPAPGGPGFTLLPPEQTRILFTNDVAYEKADANQNLLNGAGVAAGDFDGDGLCDLYFASSGGPGGLFRNLGNFQFADVTASSSTGCPEQASKGVVFADINGDARLDLIINSLSGPNACLVNLGNGRFTNVAATAGITARAGGHSAALADVDGDGDLDLYLVNYGENSILRSGGQISVRTVGGKPVVSGRHARRVRIINGQMIELGEPDTLYLNDGKGVFTAVSWTTGAFLDEQGQPLREAPWDMGLSALFHDINGDGSPDLYVCNDFQTPDRLWLNDGRGRFRAVPAEALRSTCHFSMGVDFADINRDGLDDFFVGDMLSRFQNLRMTQVTATNPPAAHVAQSIDRHQIRRNTLFIARGDGTWADIANFAGVDASDWSWSVAFLDVDLDGFEDLLVATAHAYDTQDLDMHESGSTQVGPGMRASSKRLRDYPPLRTPNFLFRNRGDLTFEEIGARWGFNSTNVSHGFALADLDLDGDLDVVVSCLGKPPLIYRNDSSAPRVAVRLRGAAPNVQGIGARIKVLGGAVPEQHQEIHCGGRYLSSDDCIRTFAAGSTDRRLAIEVTWRSGRRSVITNAEANAIYEIDEATATAAPRPLPPSPPVAAWFEDVSARLLHRHEDAPSDDLERQPLLHRSFTRLGPGLAWWDLNGDGHDELAVGAGRGGNLAVFSSDGRGGFTRWPVDAAPATEDLTALVGWSSAPGRKSLVVGLSNYDEPDNKRSPLMEYEFAGGTSPKTRAASPRAELPESSSAGALASGDIDGDGDLDLFVGGRVISGRYPQPASSRLWRNDKGVLIPDASHDALLTRLGLVSGAVFSDLTGDGLPELILACEWGPLRLFRNEAGRFKEWDAPVHTIAASNVSLDAVASLRELTGWWNGVTTGDFDGDGRLDIVASNWGLNSSYQASSASPLRLYYGDFDGNGTQDQLEAWTDPESKRIVPRRDLAQLAVGLPGLKLRFPKHALFARADVPAILENHYATARQVQATTLASVVLLNRGDNFEVRALPAEAQFSPAFGINVADADGDGHEDVFLSQNFFALRNEEPRCDSGRGLWLRGDGRGGWTAVPGPQSGIIVYGEQRGSAVGDFDEDGRVDMAVAQYGGETRLFRNATAAPGLRVRLAGPPLNPAGVGATVRLKFGDAFGPAREVHGGSGYWSQDSPVQVLATPKKATAVWVRWPGGQVTTQPVPADAREVTVRAPGA